MCSRVITPAGQNQPGAHPPVTLAFSTLSMKRHVGS